MNTHLRRAPIRNGATVVRRAGYARITDVKRTTDFVMIGDGLAIDMTPFVAGQFDSGQFTMEVNDLVEASPALRHKGGANILFVDGHVSWIKLKTIDRPLANEPNFKVKSWESEYTKNGQPWNVINYWQSPEQQGLSRNDDMPLIWSAPPKLYRP